MDPNNNETTKLKCPECGNEYPDDFIIMTRKGMVCCKGCWHKGNESEFTVIDDFDPKYDLDYDLK